MGTHEEEKRKVALEELRKGMSLSELERVKQMREFDTIKKGSPAYKLGLYVDALRTAHRNAKQEIEKSLWNMENAQGQIFRLRQQLLVDHITEEIRPGVPMNKNEVELSIRHASWQMRNEANTIALSLWPMRGTVGQHDLGGNVVLTEEDYNSYLLSVMERLKALGYGLE